MERKPPVATVKEKEDRWIFFPFNPSRCRRSPWVP
jgi:hypothetical protein